MNDPAADAPSPADKVPAEVWLEIFDQVPDSSDLYGAAGSCKMLRELTVRALRRDVVWRVPEQVAQDLPLWDKFLNMEPHVRSLTLGVAKAHGSGVGFIVDVDGSTSNASYDPRENVPGRVAGPSFASHGLYASMFAKISQFTNINSLTFADMMVLTAHFELIHRLPRLRTLKIERCEFKGRRVGVKMDHTQLPITDLTMLSIRCSRDFREHLPAPLAPAVHAALGPAALAPAVHPPVDESFSYCLSLCAAQGLRSLTIDSSADVFRGVFNTLNAQTRNWTIPPTLEHIYVVRKRSGHTGEKFLPLFGGESTFPDTHLYHFCAQATSLRTISTPSFVPAQITVAPEALPQGLERFAAPLETAQLVAGARDVQALGLIKCGVSAREGVTALTNIAVWRSGLKMLLLDCKGWDGEIVSAVAQLFKQLRRLKIVFDGPGPTEDFLVALAPDHLVELPELHTLELYELPRNGSYVPDHPAHLFDSSFESVEEELRNLVIPWNRYCPKLRRVQLHAGYVMTRGFEGAVWNLERVRRLEVKEDLDF